MDGERPSAAPLVVYTSRANSHPFQDRHIYCQDSVKIGRSVARAHPAPANAIFDCKVLSRNHALLWFEDNKVSEPNIIIRPSSLTQFRAKNILCFCFTVYKFLLKIPVNVDSVRLINCFRSMNFIQFHHRNCNVHTNMS